MATLAEILSPSMIESALKQGMSSPYASLLQQMGYNWVEGGPVPDSQSDPSGWFKPNTWQDDGGRHTDPYGDSLANMYQRYDSETGNWSYNNSYNQALANAGYLFAGTDAYGLGSQWTRATPATLGWFNQNYGTNFTDPMSYMNYLYGPGGQLINDQNHGQLYRPPEGRGINDYVNRPLSYDPPDSGMFKWAPMIIGGMALAGMGGLLPGTESIFGGASAAGSGAGAAGSGSGAGATGGALASEAGFLPGSFELGASGYGGTAAAGLDAAAAASGLGSGGGMGFFDDILGLASDEGFLPGSFELGESLYGGTAAQGLDMAAAESWLRNLVGGGLPSLGNSLMNLFGGGTGAGRNNLLGGLFGGGGGGVNLAAIAPSLAAINYARNVSPFDTSRLESLYGQFNPSANAFQYDTNTGLGREELTSSLARRGVSGSSFGDQSLTNYNTFRDLGRQSLLNQGIGTQADIASKILSSDIAERQMKNDLYGRALLALSGGLSPTNTSAFFGR